jgi:hypothetical protein
VDGQLRIKDSAPWTAVYETPGGTLTYETDLPAEQADDAVPVLQELSALAAEGINAGAAPESAAAASSGADTVSERLQRGIRKIMEMLTP